MSKGCRMLMFPMWFHAKPQAADSLPERERMSWFSLIGSLLFLEWPITEHDEVKYVARVVKSLQKGEVSGASYVRHGRRGG